MTTYRTDLPHTKGDVLLTDGGLETTLIFQQGIDLPDFASFPLVENESGRAALSDYYRSYAAIARDRGVSIVLDTPTWRASADWGARLGYDADGLHAANTASVELLRTIRAEYETPDTSIVISGNLGPRGDGYVAGEKMTAAEAEAYHRTQIRSFADAGADVITVLTVTYVEEAVGIARAAQAAAMPVVVSFTVETDGRLPTGDALGDAIEQVDRETGGYPVSYGINCAHPDHFEDVLVTGEDWVERIGLVRANASRMSHEELDNSEELDAGDAIELAEQFSSLRERLPNLVVLGGCCGTDHGHIDQIGRTCVTTTGG